MIMWNRNMMQKLKLCYVNTGNFIVYIKTDYIYKEIAGDVETKFDTLPKILPKFDHCLKKYKKVIGLMKDGIGGKIMTKFVRLRAKAYICLKNDDSEDKIAKDIKKCLIKKT